MYLKTLVWRTKSASRDAQFKADLEGYFTRLVGLMKKNESASKLQEQAVGLQQNLAKAVGLIQTETQSDWSMFLYSLMILVREGLEALLIVAAIVAYMVKNNHADKLPVIRQSVYVAFIFAGKSVLELIEGKLFEPTLVSGVSEISWLGIYPYVETLVPQIILLIAAVFALFYMKHQSRKNAQ